MKQIVFLISFIFSNSFLHAQNDSLWNLDGISKVTVLLTDTNVSGSATIINHNGRYFILTANHVAKVLTSNSEIVFWYQGDLPWREKLLPITIEKKLNWVSHSIADLSIIELAVTNKDIKKRLNEWAFPSYQINSFKDLPSKDADITFLGFPILDISNYEHFSPLTFNSHLSSGLITNFRFDYKIPCNFFYLDIPSMQGCSGSGVYYSVKKAMFFGGNVTVLIGVVHGTAGDISGGKLAAITPSYYIWDLLNKVR